MGIKQLIEMAKEVSKMDTSREEFIEKLTEYTDAFRETMEGHDMVAFGKDALAELNEYHQFILNRAVEAQSSVLEELKSLKSKGKQVLQYLDTLPKQVSTIKGKKG